MRARLRLAGALTAHIGEATMGVDRERFWAELDHLGAAQVRANLASGVYWGPGRALVEDWLERRNEAFQSEQLLLARRARDDARKAYKIAVAAFIVAVVAIILAVVGAVR
jgi:hypothetical protein